MPRLAPGCDPCDPREDSTAWAPDDRARLLSLVRQWAGHAAPRRLLLLSGDYHLCAALTLCIGGRAAGAAVVAPPLYAPLLYANAAPRSLWMNEDLAAHGGLVLEPHGVWPGSGFCGVEVQRAGAGYAIGLRRWLRSHAHFEPRGTFAEPLVIRLD